MDQPAPLISIARRILSHSLYEFKKGVRPLFMITVEEVELPRLLERLMADAVDYHVHTASGTKANLFFGKPLLVETVRTLVTKPLCHLTAEEDFILGVLLGYDREQQCARLLERMWDRPDTRQTTVRNPEILCGATGS
ncbi:DUF2023 family protein [Consotaella aegiceratis]|uniref:DUF2023 family protein n=1 Tax=Consotaella aegiceratis TaxID=3097961 RepID=UPI002F3FEE95